MGEFTAALLAHTRLRDRARYSRAFLRQVQGELAKHPAGRQKELCVFAAGSLGRFETGRVSDLDVFFLCHRKRKQSSERSVSRLVEIETFSDLIKVNDSLKLPSFSGDGRYLKIHELDDLIMATGDSRDDSENLFTTRLLLLLESKHLSNEPVYQLAIQRVMEMYFRDGRGKKNFKPLFLLNDILRYWRTLCLNYERDRAEPGKAWWKRNLNLKFSRKLTVFSTVLAIIAKGMSTPTDFKRISGKVPLERLASALDSMGDRRLLVGFRAMLNDYEDFLAAKSHKELEAIDDSVVPMFSVKAQRFDDFLHRALESKSLDRGLVRFVSI